MAIKANKEIRRFIYRLCNGIRREKDICEYLIEFHDEFTDSKETETAVSYHLSKLKSEGLIYFKYDGRIVDLQR
tara:strand:+ start:389 stop:610 length:222 start_codon:yes stop_codon:yes gene_type:complete